jgi:hypothetical protein
LLWHSAAAAEARLRAAFVRAGGQPDRLAPHYFVLGESPWFAELAQGMQSVQLPLSALPPQQTSVTYPDSFVAMEVTGAARAEVTRHAGRVYRLDELPALVDAVGLPSPSTDPTRNWRTWPAATFVEVQLWSDEPIQHWIS